MLSAIPPGHDFILVRGKNFQLRFLETIVRMKKVNQDAIHTAWHRVLNLDHMHLSFSQIVKHQDSMETAQVHG